MKASEGDFRVWWIPQIGAGCPVFHVSVESPEQAMLLMKALADYDLFQFRNRIKPDYSNAGGFDVFEDGEWSTWYDDDGRDIDELMNEKDDA